LQKVLDFREVQEDDAKQELLAKRAEVVTAERELAEISLRRSGVLETVTSSVVDRLLLEGRLEKLDFEERITASALEVLKDEASAAEDRWRERKRELQTMVKLRDRRLSEWQLDETRKEQAELDEWAVLRRPA
jgi:flagellar export protein FliJ